MHQSIDKEFMFFLDFRMALLVGIGCRPFWTGLLWEDKGDGLQSTTTSWVGIDETALELITVA